MLELSILENDNCEFFVQHGASGCVIEAPLVFLHHTGYGVYGPVADFIGGNFRFLFFFELFKNVCISTSVMPYDERWLI